MGCCAGKETAEVTATKAAVTTGNVSLVAGGAVAGAVVGGPIGLAIGAAIGLAAVGTIGKVAKPPDGLLKDLWRGMVNMTELHDKLPAIGMIRLDRGGAPVPPAISDHLMIKDVNSTLFRTVPVTAEGLDFAAVMSGAPLSAQQVQALKAAITQLEKAGVIAIVADSGLFVHYQQLATTQTTAPVLLSPLLQAPLLLCVLSQHESILTITTDSTTFSQSALESTLLKSSLVDTPAAAKRFVLRGCERLEGFSNFSSDPNKAVDVAGAQTGLIGLVSEAVEQMRKAGKPIGAILLESAILPAFSDVLRNAFPLPIFDNFTLADFAHKASIDNPRFGISFGPASAPTRDLNMSTLPSIGILRIDYTYPPALGDAAHPNSYYYRTPHATVKGLTFERAQKGAPLTAKQRSAMAKAIEELEAQGVMGIAGDCGFMMHYQKDARLMCSVPCFVSALLQAPMLSSLFAADELVLVLTANGPALAAELPHLLSMSGVSSAADQKRFVVAGCEGLPGFEAVALGQKVNVAKVMPHCVKLVQSKIREMPKIRAILLECTELPPYADAIRHATSLPVLDSITLVDYFHGAISENPYFGIDWKKLAETPAFQL